MIRPRLSPGGYRTLLRMSARRHLLVEGPTDKRLFRLLLDEYAARAGMESYRYKVDIDTADDLLSFGQAIGNREKVERICASVRDAPYADRVVGFVDREFRGFQIGHSLRDELASHLVLGRLVWSRGHSAETYFFDFATLREPLRTFSVTDSFDSALDRFEEVLDATVRLACAASLAGHECGMLWVVPKVDPSMVEVSPPDVCLNLQQWKEALMSRHGLKSGQADELAGRLMAWHAVTRAAEYRVVRWMCHGHAGLAYIWAVYSRCVHDVCQHPNPETRAAEARRVLKAEESVRFNACAASWVSKALGGECEYPGEVLSLLGISGV